MRQTIFLILLSLLPFISFGGKVYSLSKEQFASQFNDSVSLERIYCHNEKQEKVWLHCNKNTILTLILKNNDKEELMLGTIKLKGSVIEAVRYNVWIGTKKISYFKFGEVVSISIKRKFQEYEMPYVNLDSSRVLTRYRNDSTLASYSIGTESVILLINTGKRMDTIQIRENACYQLEFIGGSKTEFGVVEKITGDSIYISNFINSNMAKVRKKKFELWAYHISDIMSISLLKSGGYSYNTIRLTDCTVKVETRTRGKRTCPIWYALNPRTGEVRLYRLWQTDKGFPGVTEIDGKAIWYEGEPTR